MEAIGGSRDCQNGEEEEGKRRYYRMDFCLGVSHWSDCNVLTHCWIKWQAAAADFPRNGVGN